MEIRKDKVITGRFSEVESKLYKRVPYHIKMSQNVKFGITSNPEERARDYSNEYDDMFLKPFEILWYQFRLRSLNDPHDFQYSTCK